MRWISWVVVWGTMAMWAGPLVAHAPIGATPAGPGGYGQVPAVLHPVPDRPPGGALSPGYCEPRLPCADNAWDGYCQHKTRWQAFWYRFGSRASVHAAAKGKGLPPAPQPVEQ